MATTNQDSDDLISHVIDEYKHAERRVVCTCGWTGSSLPGPDGRSEWDRHVRSFRPADWGGRHR